MNYDIETIHKYFMFLTPKEQCDVIKDIGKRYLDDLKAPYFLERLRAFIQAPAREDNLIASCASTNRIFTSGTANELLSPDEIQALNEGHSVTMTIHLADMRIFFFWARSAGYEYKKLVTHENGATDFEIRRNKQPC